MAQTSTPRYIGTILRLLPQKRQHMDDMGVRDATGQDGMMSRCVTVCAISDQPLWSSRAHSRICPRRGTPGSRMSSTRGKSI
ncbi:unnamed protein product [Macrosiphum euphorbiae]|uniref:Uncharacterized protein n=1 Tax=Macrosiphum euphorbiae TaxID=13131 RepID=A0AAV0W5D6_9HEMI|nr:unnamed protein product [Macrosiphum euphorbiae]